MRAAQTYYGYAFLNSLGLGCMVVMEIPYLLSIGLTLGEVSLVNAVFWLTVICTEIPTGMLADGRGRAFSLVWGIVFWTAAFAVYSCAHGFYSAAVAEILLGIGQAFYSGADQAWVTDALKEEDREHELAKVLGTASAVRGVALLAGGFFGVWLASHSLWLIWMPELLLGPVCIAFVVRYMVGRGNAKQQVGEGEALLKSWRLLCRDRELAWVLVAAICFGAVKPYDHYWSVFFEARAGRESLGWIWAYIYLTVVVAGLIIRRAPPGKREGAWVVGTLATTGIGLASIGLFSGIWFPLGAVLIHEVGRGMFIPLTDTFVQHRVESSHRATYGSLQSFLGKIGFALVPLLVWVLLGKDGGDPALIPRIWAAAGIFIVISAIVLARLQPLPTKR